MSKRKQKFDFVSEEKEMAYLKEIIAFFQDERNEEIGFVAAKQVLNFFLQTIGEEVYKKAIKDTKKLFQERVDDINIELDLLSER